MSFVAPLSTLGKTIFQAGGFRSTAGVAGAPKTIGEIFKNFFTGISKPKLPTIPKPSGGTKLLIGTGIVTTGVLGTELFLLQEEGQQTLDTLDSSIEKLGDFGSGFGEGVENITDFFSQNPIIIPLLLGLGIILVVKS